MTQSNTRIDKPSKHHLPIADTTYAEFNGCIHCGLCLPACPTYLETANEAESPRGRIHLMKAVVDGRIEPSANVVEHLDSCLVCRACETACPSGVQYHKLIEAVRPEVVAAVPGKGSGVMKFMMEQVMPHPRRLAAALLPVRAARAVGMGGLLRRAAEAVPGPWGELLEALPSGEKQNWSPPTAFTAAVTPRLGAVLLLQGCVGSVLSGAVNAASVKVLAANGYDVNVLPLGQEPCCGALAAHGNLPEAARGFARRVVEILAARGDDFFISPIAGCGAQLKQLGEVLTGDASPAMQQKIRAITGRMFDITEFLARKPLRIPATQKRAASVPTVVAYHDPCHLIHGQKVASAPRQLLTQIPGVRLVELPESDVCCGAAGSYALTQPEMAAALGTRKARNIIATKAGVLATANIGCQMQIQRHLALARAENIPVRHVVELLAELYPG